MRRPRKIIYAALKEWFCETMEEITIYSKKDGSNHILVNGQVVAKLCRCGHSKNRPFCDGTHRDVGWQADEATTKVQAPAATSAPSQSSS